MADSLEALTREIAERFAGLAAAAAARAGRCTVALAGGDTPRGLYRLLADEYRDRIDWSTIHVFFGDERWVPLTDPRSNYRMARETLLLDCVPVPALNVHAVRTDLPSVEAGAADYEQQLRASFGDTLPRFDLILLGLGADGHTASLFPHSPALAERHRWVVPAIAPSEPHARLTLTLPVINNAAHVFFVVSERGKEEALRHVRSGGADPDRYPAAAVMPADGELTWWVARVA
jgi:6-phosphogluconolactonase